MKTSPKVVAGIVGAVGVAALVAIVGVPAWRARREERALAERGEMWDRLCERELAAIRAGSA